MEYAAYFGFQNYIRSYSFKFLLGTLVLAGWWFVFGVGVSEVMLSDPLLTLLIKVLATIILSLICSIAVGWALVATGLPFIRYTLLYLGVAITSLCWGLLSLYFWDVVILTCLFTLSASGGFAIMALGADEEVER